MRVHKILQGEGAELYLPFALGRVRSLLQQFGEQAYVTQRYRVGTCDIKVSLQPPDQWVWITNEEGPVYEFVTSDSIDQYKLYTPGTENLTIFGAIEAHALRVRFGEYKKKVKPKATPIYSTNLIPGEGQSWTIRAIDEPPSARLGTRSRGYFKSWASWQVQYLPETQWFYLNGSDQIVMSAFGTTRPTATCIGLGDFFKSQVVGAINNTYDIAYDLMPLTMRVGGTTEGVYGPYLGLWAWPRGGALQVVERKEFGKVVETRRFFIMGDNKGRLHVYPAKDYFNDPNVLMQVGYNPPIDGLGGFPSTGSTAIQFKTVTPNYPAWVSLADPNTLDVLLWWNWRFNKDGTKAATVAMKEEARPGWYVYNDPAVYSEEDASSWLAFPAKAFGDTNDPTHPIDYPHFHTSKKGRLAKAYTPGLIEISITIEITGPGEEDYTVAATVQHQEHYYDSGRYFVDCGYLYNDKRLFDPNDLGDDNKPKQMPEDTLMASLIDAYYNKNINEGWFSRPNTPGSPGFPNRVWDTDPTKFDENCFLRCRVDAAYVVRRMDIDREVMRFTLARNRDVAEGPYPNSSALYTFNGPTGFASPATREIYPWWQTTEGPDAAADFYVNGPNSPNAPYFRGAINKADLRSLSFILFGVEQTFIDYVHDEVQELWYAGHRRDSYSHIVVAFGEEKLNKAINQRVSPPFGFIGSSVDFSEAGNPASPMPEIQQSDRVYFPVHLHTSTFFGGIALDCLGLSYYAPLSTHPDGHCIATIADANLGRNKDRANIQAVWDVVSVKQKDGTFYEGSMRDYFNSAFDQQREYVYWAGLNAIGSGVLEAGSFNICGVWLPYLRRK